MKYVNDVPNTAQGHGPYSQAVIFAHMVFVSGQLPVHPETGLLVEGGIAEQTNQVMKNLFGIIRHLELDSTNIVKTTIYLEDLADIKTVNDIYSTWLGDARPARATIGVAKLPLGAKLEIEAIAVLDGLDSAILPMSPEAELEAMNSSTTMGCCSKGKMD